MNSAHGRRDAQLSWVNEEKHLRYCSKVWLVLSVCPLLCGWYAEDRQTSIFRALHRAFQNLEVKCTPLSGTILLGNPCNRTISLINRCAVSGAEGVLIMGKKWAILDNLSTTIRMVVNPSEGVKSTIKSIDSILQGCSGTGRGLSRPQVLVLLALLRKIHYTRVYIVLTILS